MSLHNAQTILARLATDRRFRQAFFADKEAVICDLALSPANRALLMQLSQAQMEQLARSLHTKRRMEAVPLMPWASATLGACLPERFAVHCERFQPAGRCKPGADAQAFCASMALDKTLPATTREVLRWESARLSAAITPQAGRRLYYFRCVPRCRRGAFMVLPGLTLAWTGRRGWRGISLPTGKTPLPVPALRPIAS